MKHYTKMLLLMLVLLLPLGVSAQGWDDEDVEDQVPLDGGLSLLAAGVIAYGAKKWHELKQQKSK